MMLFTYAKSSRIRSLASIRRAENALADEKSARTPPILVNGEES
jgi:hypothetical protein